VYEALSYVWGPPERCDHVLVGKGVDPHHTLPITKNLSIALHHLKLPSEPRTLWIDAICINQDDLSERSREVGNMDSIYCNANQVLVWLGSSSQNSALALQTLCRLGEGIDFNEKYYIVLKPGSWADQISYDPEALKSNAECWFAIRDLLCREWFSRLWVFQEIGLATKATIIVGYDSLDCKLVVVGLNWIWAFRTEVNNSVEQLVIEDFGVNHIAGFLFQSRKKKQSIELLDLLDVTQNLLCSDPRDHLFAIRSLLHSEARNIIKPDYTKTVEDTFTLFTVRGIYHFHNLHILKRCLWHESASTFEMPSWVPDLSFSNARTTIINPRAARSKAVFKYHQANQSLAVQGIQVATISYVATPIKASHVDCEIIDHCRSWKRLVLGASSKTECRSVSDAFSASMVTGMTKEMMSGFYGDCISLEECRKTLDHIECTGTYERALLSRLAVAVRRYLAGRSFFLTEEGFFGVCPQFSKCGDRVAVMLGCDSPLVLRPIIVESMNRFLVIGESYIEELMCNEAFLGPITKGWSVSPFFNDRDEVFIEYAYENFKTQQDPRVPLPPGWRYMYGSSEEPQEIEADNEENMTGVWFKNVVTGGKTNFDPRLTPEALRQRGVEVQELVLV
jgi:hypothetical protein